MEYLKFYNFFSDKEKKRFFLNNFNEILEKNSIRNNKWELYKNGVYGVVENDEWSWINTVNTNPKCISYLDHIYTTQTNNKLNFENYLTYKSDVKKLISFIDENWDLFFTKKINDEHYNELKLITNRSWTYGQISTLIVLINIRRLFPEYELKDIDITLDRGDVNDFKGNDMILHTSCGKKITLQIKTAVITKYKNSYYIDSSVNSMNYDVDYFCFITLKYDDLHIVVLKNDMNFVEDYDKLKHFKEELNMGKEIKENNDLKNLLREILFFCNEKKLFFELRISNDVNKLTWSSDEKTVTLDILMNEDQDKYKYFFDEFNKLKDLLN